ncbi:MAG: 16S rRNA processing protein RimM [Clostridia bacterium]|nr:16S rRNA processing protein RimM [Clostridia bacterium]
MKLNLLESGEIVNTHGIRGEVKINPWCDSPDFLLDFDKFYIDGKAVQVLGARVHKNCVLAALKGINDINAAMALRGKIISVNKDEVELDEGQYFISDLIGLEVFDTESDSVAGKVVDVLNLPANDAYVVRDGDLEYMIPVVKEFVLNVDLASGRITVKLIPGMRG